MRVRGVTRCAVSVLVAVIVAMVVGCATEPPPPIAGDLTEEQVRTAMIDAMVVLGDAMFSLLSSNAQTISPSGEIQEDGYHLVWSDTALEEERGDLNLSVEDYELPDGSIFRSKYHGYIFTGNLRITMDGTYGTLDFDVTSRHAKPERYPVTRLELHLERLGSDIQPDEVEGFIRVNGFDVDPARVADALEIEVSA
jgi:hypothetical protein